MNRRPWRRWRKHYHWCAVVIITIIPVTPTILEPIAPGCDQYGPECVIDTTTGDTPPEVVIVTNYPDPYEPLPLNP